MSKQLWFEKIRRAVVWGEVLGRWQSPAGSATLPSAGHQGEDTQTGLSQNSFRRLRVRGSNPLPLHGASPLHIGAGMGDGPHPQQSLLHSPNLPAVLMHTTFQPALRGAYKAGLSVSHFSL